MAYENCKNPERRRAYMKQHNKEQCFIHREERIIAAKLWRANNKEKAAIISRRYYNKHKEQCIEWHKNRIKLLKAEHKCVRCKDELIDTTFFLCGKCRHKGAVAAKEKRQRLRVEVLDFYGGKCVWCGEPDKVVLTIDYINNDGAAHRRQLNIKGTKIYKWLKDNNHPSDYQVLCFNCNWRKRVAFLQKLK